MKNLNHKETLIFGIGNSARQDDGLGWAFLEGIERAGSFKGELHYCYQLNIEDAELVSKAENVIFVDAYTGNLDESFTFEECGMNGEITYTTHSLNPEAILALSQDVYNKKPEAYILKIKGYEWQLEEGLTEKGEQNLKKALDLFLKDCLSLS